MLTFACLKESYRVCRRLAGALACAVSLVLAAAASAQVRAPAFAGTWKCVDAVDDNDRPYTIVIKRVGTGYEVNDPSQKPSRTAGGQLKGGRLTFQHKEKSGTSPVVFKMGDSEGRLTEEYSSGGKRLAIHFVRAPHRK